MKHQRNRQETQQRIHELRETLNDLEAQLAGMEVEEKAQHEQIEQLDHYIDAVDTKLSSLQLFWISLKQEWRKPKG
ncbi:hypothetical protein [Pseudomonas sp. UBA6323]|uniref:hypothetical protein n=1 Tax=Pseudomonas sp. UBA6323 TaxID=1947329 RepID=UPI0025D9994B|nr:hypothetical protein [Pseudomonas sp. UBA6323]